MKLKKNEKLEIKIRQIGHILEGDLYNLALLNKVGEIKLSYEDEKRTYAVRMYE